MTARLLVLLLACSPGKDQPAETGDGPDDSADTGPTDTGELCTGLDLVPVFEVSDEDGVACDPCDINQPLYLSAGLYNPCQNEVGMRFTTTCVVSRWLVLAEDGSEAFLYEEDCVVTDTLASVPPGAAVSDSCPRSMRLDPGTYTVEVRFDDVAGSVATGTFTGVDD